MFIKNGNTAINTSNVNYFIVDDYEDEFHISFWLSNNQRGITFKYKTKEERDEMIYLIFQSHNGE